jgi:hypothetical protein
VSSKTAFWIIYKRKIHDCYDEVSRHKTFDAAMEHLKLVDGVWSAFWSLNQIFKGDYTLTCVEVEEPKANGG